MTKERGIEIRPVANGFVVTPPYNMVNGPMLHDGETLVFRTLAELQHFIAEHFKHRAQVELNDPKESA